MVTIIHILLFRVDTNKWKVILGVPMYVGEIIAALTSPVWASYIGRDVMAFNARGQRTDIWEWDSIGPKIALIVFAISLLVDLIYVCDAARKWKKDGPNA